MKTAAKPNYSQNVSQCLDQLDSIRSGKWLG